ncbi:processed acidic surface protein [Shouchella clausii]|nr:processed acidic surface protein [Shouchella clausii]
MTIQPSSLYNSYARIKMTIEYRRNKMKKSLFTAIFTLLFLFSAPAASLAHGFDDEEFTAYLEDVGVSEKDLAEHLMYWWEGTTFYDFTDVSELAEFLGPRLTEEGINEIAAEFDLTRQELDELLEEWLGLPPSDLLFYNTFYMVVHVIITLEDEWGNEPYYPDFSGFLSEFSLSDEEEWALYEHFWYIQETNPNLSAELDDLKQRAYAFDGFESIRELSAADVAELFAIGEKAISVLDLHPKYYLDRVGEDPKPISYKELMSGNAIKGYDLLVELYDADGSFLADFYITAEMFNSHFVKKIVDDVTQIDKGLKDKPKKPSLESALPGKDEAPLPAKAGNDANHNDGGKKAERDENGKVTKTANGAKMPKTATNYPLYMLIGIGMSLAGVLIFRRLLREKKVA